MKKPKKIKTVPYKKLNKMAWDVYALHIKDRDNWTCLECGTKFYPGDKHCTLGHVITARKAIVRYNEDNTFAQCSSCNGEHRFQPHKYILKVIEKIGITRYGKVCELADTHKVYKIPREELWDIISLYDPANKLLIQRNA
jgi:RNase P subunit RPR2